jgi:glutamate-1-semialdehyde aminotransferase
MWHRFVRGCFERGIYFQSIGHAIGHSGTSAAHSHADIDWALNRMDDVFRALRQGAGT